MESRAIAAGCKLAGATVAWLRQCVVEMAWACQGCKGVDVGILSERKLRHQDAGSGWRQGRKELDCLAAGATNKDALAGSNLACSIKKNGNSSREWPSPIKATRTSATQSLHILIP
jgi:hypothetical protein